MTTPDKLTGVPTRHRDEIRRRWRRTVNWLGQVQWFAVFALIAAVVAVVVSTVWRPTLEQALAVDALALTMAVLSLREE